MNTVIRTTVFDRWFRKLKDTRGEGRIVARIRAAERGYFGDCRSVGKGVYEMRIHFGPGYRLYFCREDDVVYVLLCGGTKRGQRRDIVRAQAIAKDLLEN